MSVSTDGARPTFSVMAIIAAPPDTTPQLTPAHLLLPLGALAALWPGTSAGLALFLGASGALLFGNPYLSHCRKATAHLLAWSVVGLGAGMDLRDVAEVGLSGLGYTVVSIAFALSMGVLLSRWFGLPRHAGLLISVGTAICGGSAIASASAALRANEEDVSVSLAVVFVLNAVALYLFPAIGHFVGLSPHAFGLFAALAIHDTSSVVGATLQYGGEALTVGTSVKLVRALWIVPVTFGLGLLESRRESQNTAKPKRPWFILGFLIAAGMTTFFPALQPAGALVNAAAERMLVLTLFLVGACVTRQTLARVGGGAFAMSVLLWIAVGTATLTGVLMGFIR